MHIRDVIVFHNHFKSTYSFFVCDHCATEFSKRYRKRYLNRLQYCSKECRSLAHRKDGTSHKKSKMTCMTHLGVENPSQSQLIQDKKISTFQEKFGVDWFTQHPTFINASKQSDVQIRRRKTIRKNKSWQSSKIEDRIYTLACQSFGAECVERQVICHTWQIDLLVKFENLCVFIQVDGLYWHCLRDIDDVVLLEQSTSKHDRVRAAVYRRDQLQNQWFAKNDLCLLRLREDLAWKFDVTALRDAIIACPPVIFIHSSTTGSGP